MAVHSSFPFASCDIFTVCNVVGGFLPLWARKHMVTAAPGMEGFFSGGQLLTMANFYSRDVQKHRNYGSWRTVFFLDLWWFMVIYDDQWWFMFFLDSSQITIDHHYEQIKLDFRPEVSGCHRSIEPAGWQQLRSHRNTSTVAWCGRKGGFRPIGPMLWKLPFRGSEPFKNRIYCFEDVFLGLELDMKHS